jgi:hypothetical protein
MKNSATLTFALLLSLGSISALAQGGGGGGSSSSGGASAGGSAAGAASGPTRGSASAIGSPNAGSAGAGTAGVSGVPNGPANAGGLNNSGNDPSGAGNSAKVPDAPGTNTVGTAGPSDRGSTTNPSSSGAANPNTNGRSSLSDNTVVGGGSVRQNGTRMPGNGQPTTTSETNSDAQINAENRKLDAKVKSICRGC